MCSIKRRTSVGNAFIDHPLYGHSKELAFNYASSLYRLRSSNYSRNTTNCLQNTKFLNYGSELQQGNFWRSNPVKQFLPSRAMFELTLLCFYMLLKIHTNVSKTVQLIAVTILHTETSLLVIPKSWAGITGSIHNIVAFETVLAGHALTF